VSDGFTVGAALGEPTIFDCPNCKETIDSRAETCRFCGAKVDHEAAREAAALMARINQGCSDASYMSSTALALPVFFVLRFVPFFGSVGTIGFWILLFAIPVWALRWWFKYRDIVSEDPDFRQAEKRVRVAGIVVTGLLVLFAGITAASLLFRAPAS